MSDEADASINDDLLYRFNMPLQVQLALWRTLNLFLVGRARDRLILSMGGNHNLLCDATSGLGVVVFNAWRLQEAHPARVLLIDRPTGIIAGCHVIPRCINQQAFDQALDALPADTRALFLHFNVDSPFAVHCDQSLNLSRARYQTLAEAGITVIAGHEHHARDLCGDRVIITGNQWPASLVDIVTLEGQAT